ncbi:hypothetical protein KIPB_014184, partial [Kipferlia bialata]
VTIGMEGQTASAAKASVLESVGYSKSLSNGFFTVPQAMAAPIGNYEASRDWQTDPSLDPSGQYGSVPSFSPVADSVILESLSNQGTVDAGTNAYSAGGSLHRASMLYNEATLTSAP